MTEKSNVIVRVAEKNPLKGKAKPKYEKPDSHWIFILGFLAAVPAFSGDMYLPSLTALMVELNTTQEIAQLTISTAMLGAAVGQLITGPALDRFGRRHPVMIGLFVHIVMSIVCATAQNIVVLLIARIIQGAANSAANVTALAVLRDKFEGKKGAQMMSRLVLIIGIAPLLAPTVGSALVDFGGWRTVFWLLALMGAGLLVAVWRKLPDTHPTRSKLGANGERAVPRNNFINDFKALAKDRQFIFLAMSQGLSGSLFMSWVVCAPFVTEDAWGFSPYLFALAFAANGVCTVTGAQINAFIVKRFPLRNIMRFAICMQLGAGLLFLALLTFTGNTPILLVAICVMFLFQNMQMANGFTIAMAPHATRAGTAASIIGVSNSIIPSILSAIVGFIGGNSPALSIMFIAITVTIFTVQAFGTDVFGRGVKNE
ncbi:MAG: multidrug effflux MFS transporter [Bifidobacteriaceae bacterium]|nr:multidrug effflux MFS transporter [Bifidobacteriaceae bacterium]